MRVDRRQRFKCFRCNNTAQLTWTEPQSNKTRVKIYYCKDCDMNFKTIEEIVQSAKFMTAIA